LAVTAFSFADQLRSELARRNIPSNLYELSDDWVAVSIWRGLVARTDGQLVWWVTPYLSHRDQPLVTYACHARSAARRLSDHYLAVRVQYPVPLGMFAEICAASRLARLR